MNTSYNNRLNILNLPNEILLIIINKLNMVNVLYSLVDVNERFNHLILHSSYIHNLNMIDMTTINSYFDGVFIIHNHVLNRICEKILPRIHLQIKELTVDQHSIQRILSIVHYPQLYSLSLVNFREKWLFQYLTEVNSKFYTLLTQQINNLNIDILNKSNKLSKTRSNIFALILSLCKQLVNLNFCQLYYCRSLPIRIYHLPSTSCVSSTLMKLKISVSAFSDCLYLLDGRLNCLSTLIIHVECISFSVVDIDNTKKLPKLKCFSLTSDRYTLDYDKRIIPLLHRMINLEDLTLFLLVFIDDSTYIDGVQLHDQILMYMPRLNKFTFSINTVANNEKSEIHFQSIEDLQRSFLGKEYGQVGSCVQTDSTGIICISHIYSLPYQFEDFFQLNNSFQGGMFDKVRCLIMNDTYPFEHELFKIISHDFPFLKQLRIWNDRPQKNKHHSSTLNVFPHLIFLDLHSVHVDYAEEFLYDKKTHMPHLVNLRIKFETLVIVTNNFANDAARLCCAKLKKLDLDEPFVPPENFHQYFSSL